MSSAAATSFTCTPGKLLNFTAVALNRSPYFSILRGLAFATTHLQPVRPRCQLNRGKLGVGQQPAVRALFGRQTPIAPQCLPGVTRVEVLPCGIVFDEPKKLGYGFGLRCGQPLEPR